MENEVGSVEISCPEGAAGVQGTDKLAGEAGTHQRAVESQQEETQLAFLETHVVDIRTLTCSKLAKRKILNLRTFGYQKWGPPEL